MSKNAEKAYFGNEVDLRLFEHDLMDYSWRTGFNVVPTNELMDAYGENPEQSVDQAVATLLQFAGCVVNFVDISRKVRSYGNRHYEYPLEKYMLGFNDHFGGSESYYKILLNQSPDGDKASYVLLSPPLEDGSPSNMTFHRCDFTFLSREPSPARFTKELRYGPFVPNPLKTHHTRNHWDRKYYFTDYNYYLFGLPNAKQAFFKRFEDIGFEFSKEPYVSGYGSREARPETAAGLNDAESNAKERLGFYGTRFWPGDQFAPQLAELGQPIYLHPEYRGRLSELDE